MVDCKTIILWVRLTTDMKNFTGVSLKQPFRKHIILKTHVFIGFIIFKLMGSSITYALWESWSHMALHPKELIKYVKYVI